MGIQRWSLLLGMNLCMVNLVFAKAYEVQYQGNINDGAHFQTVERLIFSKKNISTRDELKQAFDMDLKENTVDDTWQCKGFLSSFRNKLSKDEAEIYEIEIDTITISELEKRYNLSWMSVEAAQTEGTIDGKKVYIGYGTDEKRIGICRVTSLRKEKKDTDERKVRETIVNKLKSSCVITEDGTQVKVSAEKSATWPFIKIYADGLDVFSLSEDSASFRALTKKDRNGLLEKIIIPTHVSIFSKLVSNEEKGQRDLEGSYIEYDFLQDTARLVLPYKEPEERKGLFNRAKRYVLNEPDPRLEISLTIESCR